MVRSKVQDGDWYNGYLMVSLFFCVEVQLIVIDFQYVDVVRIKLCLNIVV